MNENVYIAHKKPHFHTKSCEKIREVERGIIKRGIIKNRPVRGRDNFVADHFLDGKPVKLSKNGSDVIFSPFHDSSCSSIVDV